MNFKVTLCLAVLFAPEMLHAKLNFPQTSVHLKAMIEDKSLASKFTFTNTGQEAVDVLSVASSCACTVPTLDKKHYEPGESGTISVAYHIGINEGKQSQTITVVTNEKTENSYELTFNADLPPGVRGGLPLAEPVTPRLLYWTRKPFDTKTVTVALKGSAAAKLKVTCDRSDDFKIETEELPGKQSARIKVTPNASLGEVSSELVVWLESNAGKSTSHKVFLKIAPGKRTASP